MGLFGLVAVHSHQRVGTGETGQKSNHTSCDVSVFVRLIGKDSCLHGIGTSSISSAHDPYATS